MANLPSETADQRYKLVQVLGSDPAGNCAERDNGETEHVLLPFNGGVLLPTPGEDPVLHDPDSREQLERGGQ